MTKKLKKIGILTSGGDSPGMNCAIRSIVRTALSNQIEVVGIERGYLGILNKKFRKLDVASVGNILQRGGTILYTSRCPEFHEKETRKKAFEILQAEGIEGLIVIGGNGSFMGAWTLHQETQIPVIGIPGTIDNDISGTEYTIGFDTAVETAIGAVDKIRDTAEASDRTFLIEVMGANSSSIALKVGICTGAENVLLSTELVDYKKVAQDIRKGIKRGKRSSIIIVAEGKKPGRAYDISKKLLEDENIQSKVAILGHIQRGGSPVSNDRFFSGLMGIEAVNALVSGCENHAIVVRSGKVMVANLDECHDKADTVYADYIGVAESLSK
jgi:6-phosphofructokinase 1